MGDPSSILLKLKGGHTCLTSSGINRPRLIILDVGYKSPIVLSSQELFVRTIATEFAKRVSVLKEIGFAETAADQKYARKRTTVNMLISMVS